MGNFWDFSTWGFFNLVAVLLISLLVANMLKRSIPALEASLIPTSVLGGGILLVISAVYNAVTGTEMFNTPFFGGNGAAWLEMLTYHMLALGFTASALKSSDEKMTKERSVEIFNTGLTTVATYLLQAFVGMVICIIGAIFMKFGLAPAIQRTLIIVGDCKRSFFAKYQFGRKTPNEIVSEEEKNEPFCR